MGATVPHYSLLHEIVQVIFILLERLTAHDEGDPSPAIKGPERFSLNYGYSLCF